MICQHCLYAGYWRKWEKSGKRQWLVASASSGNAPSYVRGNSPRGPINKGVLSEIRHLLHGRSKEEIISAFIKPGGLILLSVILFFFPEKSLFFDIQFPFSVFSRPSSECFVSTFLGKSYLESDL